MNETILILAVAAPAVLLAGAFFWIDRARRRESLFRVEVESNDGRQQAGWVRLGSAWLGLASHKADIKWIDQPPQT